MSRQACWLLWWWLLLLAPMAQAGTKYYYYTDAQGTPLAKADAQGTIVERYDYTPYGVPVQGNGPDGPGYTGHVNDPETGLVYMQQRYYDPAGGRFLSLDSAAVTPGNIFNFNRYSYANNDPYRFVDLDGRDSTWVSNGKQTNIVIPVHFTGAMASTNNINAIVLMAKKLEVLNRNYTITIIPSDKPINGQINTMNLDSGYDFEKYKDAGEGINRIGGDNGHINTDNPGWLRGALHDILHFASFKDGYRSSGIGDARVLTGYDSGYDSDNIMANRIGNIIRQDEIDYANDRGSRQGTNKYCPASSSMDLDQCI